MTILFDATRPVKPARTRRFGRGILRSLPNDRVDYTAADRAWWADESARLADLDAEADQMALEAAAVARLEMGIAL